MTIKLILAARRAGLCQKSWFMTTTLTLVVGKAGL